MSDIRALTIKQPWASRVAFHGKTVENRTWSTRWRGTLLIHAAKTPDRGEYNPDHLVRGRVLGAVLAAAELVDCHSDDGPCTNWSETGAFHWTLHAIRPLRSPVFCGGRLGLWTPEPELLADVRAQLGAER